MSSTAIAKMCGTSTEMIDNYYTSNMALDTMMDTFNKFLRFVFLPYFLNS